MKCLPVLVSEVRGTQNSLGEALHIHPGIFSDYSCSLHILRPVRFAADVKDFSSVTGGALPYPCE